MSSDPFAGRPSAWQAVPVPVRRGDDIADFTCLQPNLCIVVGARTAGRVERNYLIVGRSS